MLTMQEALDSIPTPPHQKKRVLKETMLTENYDYSYMILKKIFAFFFSMSLCLYLLNTGITGMYHHIWLLNTDL
jgi:hypothetical protein